MKFKDTEITGCYEITVDKFDDDRGYFLVPFPFNKEEFGQSKGYLANFKQDNESQSKYGVIRGLHYQKKEHAQSKLVRCVYGNVRDVVVDLRPYSKSYKKVLTFDLTTPNHMILIPKGCAHGFSVISEMAIFSYKVDRPWNKESEGGIRYDDPTLNIDWGIPRYIQKVNDKDLLLPYFAEK